MPETAKRPSPLGFGKAMFYGSIAIYVLTRTFWLDRFPYTFVADEAVHSIHARELLANNFHSASGQFLPVYFQNSWFWNLSLSVYIHIFTVLVGDGSIYAVRLTAAAISVLLPLGIALSLKNHFNLKSFWLGVAVVGSFPVWLLHSRTGFETVLAASFYSMFIYYYIDYRVNDPRNIDRSIFFAALTFYSYTNGQGWILATSAILLVVDFKYHLENKNVVLRGIALAALLSIPRFLFQRSHPGAVSEQLHLLNSYWLASDLTTVDKVLKFAHEYLYAFSPRFLFGSSSQIPRHYIGSVGNFQLWMAPFFFWGAARCLIEIRDPRYRVIVISAAAIPMSAAIVSVNNLRVMALVVPLGFLGALGVSSLINSLKIAAPVMFSVLNAFPAYLLFQAVYSDRFWPADFGFYGLQWGAREIFQEKLPKRLRINPAERYFVTPNLGNTSEYLSQFFAPNLAEIREPNYFITDAKPIPPNAVFVVTNDEFVPLANNKALEITTLDTLPFPNGAPGFFLVRVGYSRFAAEYFEQQRSLRNETVQEIVPFMGQQAKVVHSKLDAGKIQNVFDGSEDTLARGAGANPFILEIYPTSAVAADSVKIVTARARQIITITLRTNAGTELKNKFDVMSPPIGEPETVFNFDRLTDLTEIRISIEEPGIAASSAAYIHVREVQLSDKK